MRCKGSTSRGRNGIGCCVIQRGDHNARRRTVMIIKSATRFALAAGCLTAIVTLPTADAQMGAPGGYGYAPPPGSYGYGPPPGPYGYGPPPGAYGPFARRLWCAARPLWPAARALCPVDPVCRAALRRRGRSPADNQ